MDDPTPPIFTIGYGNDSFEDVFARLRSHGVGCVIDVRSQPYSKWSPQFSKDALIALLSREKVRYVFMGDSLGGRPSDPTCYTDDKVDYTLVDQRDWYRNGIERLCAAWRQGQRVVLMCSEIDPERCHRSKLIGQTLDTMGVPVRHIDRDGSLATQKQVIDRLTGGQCTLFGDDEFTSNAKYSPTGS